MSVQNIGKDPKDRAIFRDGGKFANNGLLPFSYVIKLNRAKEINNELIKSEALKRSVGSQSVKIEILQNSVKNYREENSELISELKKAEKTLLIYVILACTSSVAAVGFYLKSLLDAGTC